MMRQQIRDLRFKIWTWYRASSVTPDPAYQNRQAMLEKILWLQDQLDAAISEIDRLKTKIAKDDYILGRPHDWIDFDVDSSPGGRMPKTS